MISALFLLTGVMGFVFHASDFSGHGPWPRDLAWVCLVRLLAILCAVFLLRGANWARWLAVFWLAYHVLLSLAHSTRQAIIHALLLALISYFLFRRPASVYFSAPKAPAEGQNP